MEFKSMSSILAKEADHASKWGGYNDLPPSMTDLSQEEGLGLLTRGASQFTGYEHRQPTWKDDTKTEGPKWGWLGEMHLYWLTPEDGFGYWRRYVSSPEDKPSANAKDNTNEYQVKFFRFGCKHEYTSREIGNCLSRATCSKCKHSYEIDSSG